VRVIEPIQRDDVLLADIASTARREDDSLRLWWLGQAGFLVQWRGHHLLFDPYLSDSLTTKYAGTDKPHVRMTARAIDPSQLRTSSSRSMRSASTVISATSSKLARGRSSTPETPSPTRAWRPSCCA
jgi:hypothetical protein